MSKVSIQQQFNDYLQLLNKIHNLDQDLDGLINEVEISALQEQRSFNKKKLKRVTKDLIESLNVIGEKYPIQNYLANQTTYLYVQDEKLVFESK